MPKKSYLSIVILFCIILLTGQVFAGQGALLEELTVPNDKAEKVTSKVVLETGKIYLIEGSGEISDWANKTDGVDPVWCYADWKVGSNPVVWDQLRIDDKGMTEIAGDKLPYNSNHTYSVKYEGQGKPVVFNCLDAMNSAADNSGFFTVKIYEYSEEPLQVRKTFYFEGIDRNGNTFTTTLETNKFNTELSDEQVNEVLDYEKEFYDPARYTRIEKCTKKQNCAGLVVQSLWGNKYPELKGQYTISSQDFCSNVVFEFGENIADSYLSLGAVEKNDIVVYGGGQHVAIVTGIEYSLGIV